MLIALYGINNIGKSTQVKHLVSLFREKGFTVEYIKYPVYSLKPSGELLDYYLRNPQAPRIDGKAFQELYIQNRKDYEPELKRLLTTNDVVLAEDYIGTGLAWGMTQGVDPEWLERRNREELTVRADLEILMDGERFFTGKEKGHLNEENDLQIEHCRRHFLSLAKRFGWPVVDANQPKEKVTNDLLAVIEPSLKWF